MKVLATDRCLSPTDDSPRVSAGDCANNKDSFAIKIVFLFYTPAKWPVERSDFCRGHGDYLAGTMMTEFINLRTLTFYQGQYNFTRN